MGDVYLKSGEQPRNFNFGTLTTIVNTTTTVANSMAIKKESPHASFQAIVNGTGTVGATVVIQVSNEESTGQGTNANWITLGTITLSGTTTNTDGFNSTSCPWRYVRASVTAVSGTNAVVSVIMGV